MLGAFAAGGAVIGLARTFVTDLGGGDPGYGLLFGTVFLGMAGGMLLGPRLLPDFSRRRMFGLSIVGAGLALALLGLIPNLVLAVLLTLVIGAFTGVAWVTGYTMLGLEVPDELRGRTFAFVQTMVRVVLVAVLAVSPLLAAAFGRHQIEVTDALALTYNGAAFVFLLAGLLAATLGFVSYRHMDDRRGVPLSADIAAAFHSEPVGLHGTGPRKGFFVALEGGEGAGKSTQARALALWLESLGHDVVVTFEPGATEVGRRLRSVLLDHPEPAAEGEAADVPPALAARTEALLFAADRAEHVATVVAPALALGHIVVSDRYTDSSVAYQGAGRELSGTEVGRLSRWATDGLQPQLTVVLDVPAAEGPGPGRGAGPAGVRADRVPRAGPRAVPRPGPAGRLPLPRRRRHAAARGDHRGDPGPARAGPAAERAADPRGRGGPCGRGGASPDRRGGPPARGGPRSRRGGRARPAGGARGRGPAGPGRRRGSGPGRAAPGPGGGRGRRARPAGSDRRGRGRPGPRAARPAAGAARRGAAAPEGGAAAGPRAGPSPRESRSPRRTGRRRPDAPIVGRRATRRPIR